MFSATDIASFLACRHTATLARAESKDEITKPFFKNQAIDLLRTLGIEHERRYLRELSEKGSPSITQIAIGDSWKDAVAETIEALRQGVDAVYQGTFLDAPWRGRSDFLVRVNTPSALGSWSYEVVETKLARSTKATALVQLCFYSDLLTRIQGTEPQWMHVVLGGTTSPERFQVQRYIAYFRKIRSEYETAWKAEMDTYPEPVEHCEVCSWFSVCDTRRRADDHPSLVAGISRNQRKALAERSVTTVTALAKLPLPAKPKIERIGDAALVRIREQARLQVQGREEGRLIYELLDGVEDGNGLAALPAPSSSDLLLDLESNPYVLDQGLEYLIGIVTPPANSGGEPVYETLWSFTRSEEKKAFETFREDMADSVDVLFVDEAGQISLANVLALSPAATSIVLLGDPQQLDQPQRGLHPLGAEVSALGHLLNGRATITADQGVFLTETRRLHPDVCAFTSELFYEGRLTSRPENAKQRLNAAEPLGGTGLRFAPVEHTGNQNESQEEVERVAALVDGLLRSGATWTNKKNETHPMGFGDILVVAPYNAQVAALIERLPTGSRVGTVDKFQGQEAPVVFYSMATSTPEDAPRGMEFLYSLNRLNVAVSRARCVAVIVASPALFNVQCRTPRQIELVNAFCRYLEMARPA